MLPWAMERAVHAWTFLDHRRTPLHWAGRLRTMARRDDRMSDWDFDRRMEDAQRRRGVDDDDADSPIMMFVYIFIGFAAVVGAAGWLDAQFGWGLVDWIMGMLKNGSGT